MKNKITVISILGIFIFGMFLISPSFAAVPSEKFTVQGILKDSSGDLVSATKDITLKFYTASTGGTLRYTVLSDDNVVSSGLFTITVTVPYDNFFDEALFIEFSLTDSDGVSNAETLSPRVEMMGAPYSIASLKAGNDFDFLEKKITNATSINATSIEIGNTVNGYAANFTGTHTSTAVVLINNTSSSAISSALRIDLFPTTSTVANCFLILNDRDNNLGNWCGNSLDGTTFTTGAGFNMTLGGGASGDFTVDTRTFTVDSQNDRVGIGTTNPLKPFHVEISEDTGEVALFTNPSTNANADGIVVDINNINTPGTANCYMTFLDGNGENALSVCGNGVDGVRLFAENAINMTLGGNANDDFTVDDRTFAVDSENNRVGIGTTNPLKAFHAEISDAGDIVLFTNRNTGAGADVLTLDLNAINTPGVGNCFVIANDGNQVAFQICGDGQDGIIFQVSSGEAFTVKDGFLSHGSPTELTIATGGITPTQTYHQVDTEVNAAADDLSGINGCTGISDAGKVLILTTIDDSRDVTIKSGTIETEGAGDVLLDTTKDTASFICNGSQWLMTSFSNNE